MCYRSFYTDTDALVHEWQKYYHANKQSAYLPTTQKEYSSWYTFVHKSLAEFVTNSVWNKLKIQYVNCHTLNSSKIKSHVL